MQKKSNRLYKSRLFAMIFEEKEKLLELYNAVNGTDYKNPELLEINTLENAIYMSMKNDISFLIDARLSLYEHQSTYSPNLPLRFLFYLSDLYGGMTRDANLYGTKRVQLPPPRFLVFYNGAEERPARETLKLSQMYALKEEKPRLELEVLVLNINLGYNQELMDASHTLWEYARYTGMVREYAGKMPVEQAVERAVTECIQEGILKEFLEKNRAEAMRMSIYEYDEARHIRQEREDAWEDGKQAGLLAGKQTKLRELVEKKLAKGKSIPEIAEALEESEDKIRELVQELEAKEHISSR